MKTFFSRAGNKSRLANVIIPMFPQHTKYVEPFFGSGAIFFNKEKSKVEIINDIDKDLMNAYHILNEDIDKSKIPKCKTIESAKQFFDQILLKDNITIEEQLRFYLIKFSGGFNSKPCLKSKNIYRNYQQHTKLNKLDLYQERLKNVEILNTDYKEVIKKYDDDHTLFYLDPPYEKSDKIYPGYSYQIDYFVMRDLLKNIKGLFVLSLNDSDNIREIFKDFIITIVSVKGQGFSEIREINENLSGIGRTIRKELLISNFILL